MQGLPEHLPEEGLHKQLEKHMASLGIARDAFTCDKLKKRKFANVTFGSQDHGRKFLQKHGEKLISTHNGTGRPRRKAMLNLMGNDVFCKISVNPNNPNAPAGKPDPINLRALQHAAEERAKPTHKKRTDGAPEVLSIGSLSCGHNVWDGERLVFVPEAEFEDTGVAKFSKQILLIKLQSKHVIKIPLDTIRDLTCSFRHTLTLTLSEEPQFFADTGDLADLFQRLSLAMGNPSRVNEPTRKRLSGLSEKHSQVVGQCLVYQMRVFDQTHVSGPRLDQQILALKHHDVLSSVFARFDLMTQRTPPIEYGPSRKAMGALMQRLSEYTNLNALPFGILFQLQALAWNAYLHPGTVFALAKEIRQLYDADKAAGRRTISVDAFKMLMKQTDWPIPNGDPSEFRVASIVQFLQDQERKFSMDVALRQGLHSPSQNLTLVHKVTVTPTRTTLHGPELEAKNRILRKFPSHHEYFIRVQFCDENGLDLFFHPKINYDGIYDKFKRVLQEGIQIAGRTYGFLGFSHSSLRSHSAWVSRRIFFLLSFLTCRLADCTLSFLPHSSTTTGLCKRISASSDSWAFSDTFARRHGVRLALDKHFRRLHTICPWTTTALRSWRFQISNPLMVTEYSVMG